VAASDIAAIQTVVGRYLNAFMTFDIGEAKAVWPSVNERALSRAFSSVDEQQLELNECSISVAGSNADASCPGILRYVPKVGTRTMRIQRRQWRFELRNSDSRWFIENVEVR